MKHYLIGLVLMLVLFSACKDDEEPPVAEATFTVTIENAFTAKDFLTSGVFNTAVGATAPGPAMPGSAYEFSFHAGKGARLSFATMFVQSNDLFYAPAADGLDLYPNGTALTGDITSEIDLWDAGTEVNQEPGTGADQAPRQAGPNTGAAENGTVELIKNVSDGFTYPTDEEVIKVMVAHDGGTMFTVTIQNVSDQGSFATPFAPGAYVVHGLASPLFVEGEADAGNGLEGVAEDGNVGPLGDYLAAKSGYESFYAPGVYAVHSQGTTPIFTDGAEDLGEGLEALAEDGDPAGLNTALTGKTGVSANGVFNTPTGASSPGPLFPGETYEFTITAKDGDYLNLATMLVQTNDLFYAFDAGGIALFNAGVPIDGDMTSKLSLWDAGTEVNEYPGAGNNQPVRQAGANTGTTENGQVVRVNDGFTYPSTVDAIKVTVTKM